MPFYGRYGVVALFFFKFFCIIYLTSYHWTYRSNVFARPRGFDGPAASSTESAAVCPASRAAVQAASMSASDSTESDSSTWSETLSPVLLSAQASRRRARAGRRDSPRVRCPTGQRARRAAAPRPVPRPRNHAARQARKAPGRTAGSSAPRRQSIGGSCTRRRGTALKDVRRAEVLELLGVGREQQRRARIAVQKAHIQLTRGLAEYLRQAGRAARRARAGGCGAD